MAAPWEKDWSSFAAAPVTQTPAANAKPWEKDWSGAANATAPAAPVSTGEDVLKSGGVGTVKGTAGLLGLPGDAASLLNRGLNALNDWLGPKLGYSPEEIAKTKANGSPLFPTSGDVQKGIGEHFGPVLEAARLGREAKLSDLVTGEGGGFKFYEPQ